MRRACAIAMLAPALAFVGACGAKPAASTEPRTSLQPSGRVTEEADTVGERSSPPPVIETPDAERAGPERVAESDAPAPEPSAAREARAMPGPEARDDDGRPEWWLREPRWSEARLTICAEALGESVRDARRAAVDAGLERLRMVLEREAEGAEVVVTTVRPLPVPAQAPGGMRYVGYVMVTVRTDDAGAR